MDSFLPQVKPASKSKFNAGCVLVPAGFLAVGLMLIALVVAVAFMVNDGGISVAEPGMRVLIIEDNDKRLQLTEAQKDAIESNADDSITGIVRAAKGDMLVLSHKNTDLSKSTAGFREMYALWDKSTLPYIVIVNHRNAFAGPLDDNSKQKVQSYVSR